MCREILGYKWEVSRLLEAVYIKGNGRLSFLGVNVWFEAEGKVPLGAVWARPMCHKERFMRRRERWSLRTASAPRS